MADAPASPSNGKPSAQGDDARNRVLGILRLVVVWVAAGALAWFGKPSAEEWLAGLALAAIGEGIRIYAAGYLVKTKDLITGGPYRFVRNPLYLGRLVILTGLSIAARMPHYENLVFLAVGCGIFFFYYMPRKERTEPRRLEQIYGERYRRYFEAVPAIFPRLTPYDAPHGSWKWANFGKNEEALMVVSLTVFFAVLAFNNEAVRSLFG